MYYVGINKSIDLPESNGASVVASFGSGGNADWFHGELSREEAEQTLTATANPEDGSFLFRHSQGELFLSVKYQQGVSHYKIVYETGGYKLEGSTSIQNHCSLGLGRFSP